MVHIDVYNVLHVPSRGCCGWTTGGMCDTQQPPILHLVQRRSATRAGVSSASRTNRGAGACTSRGCLVVKGCCLPSNNIVYISACTLYIITDGEGVKMPDVQCDLSFVRRSI